MEKGRKKEREKETRSLSSSQTVQSGWSLCRTRAKAENNGSLHVTAAVVLFSVAVVLLAVLFPLCVCPRVNGLERSAHVRVLQLDGRCLLRQQGKAMQRASVKSDK